MFRDRSEAAHRLAEALRHLRGKNPLVLAIPRGAVPMGRIIADELEGELDVVLVHKLGAPGNAEFAIGAVDEEGHVEVADWARGMGIDRAYIDTEADRQGRRLRERRARYMPVSHPIERAGRQVVVVDDGVATGSTMKIALRSVRRAAPEKLIAAVAVAPPDAVRALEEEADEVVCLHSPEVFRAVGEFFRDFRQVEDDEVVRELRKPTRQS